MLRHRKANIAYFLSYGNLDKRKRKDLKAARDEYRTEGIREGERRRRREGEAGRTVDRDDPNV